jgi:hypothetical protein
MIKTIYQCDFCGKEVAGLYKRNIVVDVYNGIERKRDIEICDSCLRRYSNAVNSAVENFIRSTDYFKTHCNSKGNFIDVGKFRMVGTHEQGGYKCPRCGTVNNAYVFDGACEDCGYEE